MVLSGLRQNPNRALIMPSFFSAALLLAAAFATHVGTAPSSLVATSATRSAVALSWASTDAPATQVIVERKALGATWPTVTTASTLPNTPATPVTIAQITGTTATDSRIDAFATYVYRVRSIGPGNTLSAPSNELIVGPPPVGFTSVIAAPSAMHTHDREQFASVTRMALDANGDPLVAYLTNDLNNDGELQDSDLSVITWNRARYRWNPPVAIDTVGNVARAGTRLPFSIARDASTGTLGVLHVVGDHDLDLSTSDDGGVKWKRVRIDHSGNEEPGFSTPSLAMAGGKIHVAYAMGGNGVAYKSGAVTSAPTTWTLLKAPLLPGTESTRNECVSLALDGSGKPIVGYCLNATTGYTVTAALWQPETNSAVKITDTNERQSDDPGLDITALGSQVAAVFYSPRDDKFFANHHLWFAKSTNGGAAWSPAVVLADDGGNTMGAPVSVTLDRSGRPAVVANVDGGSDGANKCGQPKLMRSVDGAAFTICAPDTKGIVMTTDPVAPTARFADNDKLYVVFKIRQSGAGLPPGIVLWRER